MYRVGCTDVYRVVAVSLRTGVVEIRGYGIDGVMIASGLLDFVRRPVCEDARLVESAVLNSGPAPVPTIRGQRERIALASSRRSGSSHNR